MALNEAADHTEAMSALHTRSSDILFLNQATAVGDSDMLVTEGSSDNIALHEAIDMIDSEKQVLNLATIGLTSSVAHSVFAPGILQGCSAVTHQVVSKDVNVFTSVSHCAMPAYMLSSPIHAKRGAFGANMANLSARVLSTPIGKGLKRGSRVVESGVKLARADPDVLCESFENMLIDTPSISIIRMKVQQLTARTQVELGKLSLDNYHCNCATYGCLECVWGDVCQTDTDLFTFSVINTENKASSDTGVDEAPALLCSEACDDGQSNQNTVPVGVAAGKGGRKSSSRKLSELMSSKMKGSQLPKKKLDKVKRKPRSVGKNNTLTTNPTSHKLQMLKQTCMDQFMVCSAARTSGDAHL